MNRQTAEERTKNRLVNYFKVLFEAAGLCWDSDNAAEVEEIVENLMDYAESIARDEIVKHETYGHC